MKQILIITGFIFFAGLVNAQKNEDWKLLQSANGIEIYSKDAVCNPAGNDVQAEVILLKVVNTTSQKARVSWHNQVAYNGECKTCNNNEYRIELELGPNQTIENTGNYKNRLIVHKRFVNKPNPVEFTSFSIAEFNVLK
ncbi:MAG: hypothetical protein N2167_02655 [Flavobacteriales bacterium]|nr:hypothetical protein [Flavobacteriales bacterium]